MRWDEIRNLYPNQWVKLQVFKSHEMDGYLYIDEMEFIKVISSDKDATVELLKSKDDSIVFHTSHEIIRTKLIKSLGLFRRIPS